jgi:cell wall-associated NlpC family hydrolase
MKSLVPGLERYIGIPFKSKGRGYDGVDCWGLLRLIYKDQLSIELPSYTDEYISATNSNSVAEIVNLYSLNWTKIASGREKMFDAVLFMIKGLPVHIGVVMRFGTMIHVLDERQSCVERYNTSLWKKRIRGFYRYAK